MKNAKLTLVSLLVATAACYDLEVTNTNNPNRETVVENSQDMLALISNALLQWFQRSGDNDPNIALTVMADEFTTGFLDFGGQDLSKEPRLAVNNAVVSSNAPPHRVTWGDYYNNIAALNTALQAAEASGEPLLDAAGKDMTTEALAFAKFFQGLNHGYVALMFDQGYIYSETVDPNAWLPEEKNDSVINLLRPYGEVMDTALAELDSALQLASSKSFTYPASAPNLWFLGYARTNQDLVRLIHTYVARLMVYVARNPAERQAVDWNAVIQHIDQGITSTFEVMGAVDIVESDFKNRCARQRTTTPGDFMRVDYRLVGPADQGSGFMNWWALPWAQRNAFKMTNVQDRRIVGQTTTPTTCTRAKARGADCGLYMGYHSTTVFNADRGLGQRSNYFFHRYGEGTSWQDGPMPIVNVAEMDLLKAEGLIRLNRAAEAVPLINKYRVTNGQLPAVTVDGVPGTAPNCTPRKLSGACGSLWDALRYEKRIETIGLEGGPAYYDARGWDFLVQYTPIHFPVPYTDLQLLELGVYSWGGAGGAGGAPGQGSGTAPAWEKCPVSLTGCP